MSDMPSILSEKQGNLYILTLNRPDKLNSFNAEMHQSLHKALDDAVSDKDCRALVLTGAGRAFCAGQDLSERDPDNQDKELDLGATLDKYYNPFIRRLRDLEMPVICAVNGVAAGAGANIALACDVVFAAKSAKFIQAFCKIGLVPDCGGTWTLTHLLGEARAKMLMLTGMPLSAEKAEDWGLIWQAVDDEKLMEVAIELAKNLSEGPTFGLGQTKQLIQRAWELDLSTQLDLERDTQRRAGKSDDYAEGVRAFLEKRPAKFSGK
ncbi:MAG: 2-(1,2-epoxy-1,2-dihydrophenyl)acetyl-CoA isomerase PaaG [Alphaproteobacteria bacterium]|nr:2-(1,2-epoxy-1,2-dihydrophenyl)acetyl-CoA isomerase PaaG [Alphaproteobacteria bacterium]